MRKIDLSLGEIAGAVANGSETDRWFIDVRNGRLFLISALYQSDEEVARAVDMIKADPDNYIPLPYLSHEEFLEEVEMYTRTLADKPNLARYLLKAVEDKAPRSYIHQLLNHEPGENQNFANFYFERVQERVALWVDSQNIKLTK